jgi:hypothetical protein
MTIARVVSIGDDARVCDLWNPITNTWQEDAVVSKPYHLRHRPVCDVRYPDETMTPTLDTTQSRDASYVDIVGGADHQEFQKVDPPYFVGDLLVAVRIQSMRGIGESTVEPTVSGNSWSTPSEIDLPGSDGYMPMTQSYTLDGVPIYWQDMNIAGRRWRSISHGITAYSNREIRTVDYLVPVQVPIDIPLESYGDALEVDTDNETLKNVSNNDLVGVVEWAVTAERYLPANETVESWLEVLLYNGGSPVTGLTTRMTSSRRGTANQGEGAVNSCAGHAIQKLEAGAAFSLWIQKGHPPSPEEPNDWNTVANLSHITFHTLPMVGLN